MPNACSVPSAALDFGKYSCANTNPVTVLYRKKSYHSIVVPTVLAITARVSCLRPSGSKDKAVKLDTGYAPPRAYQERACRAYSTRRASGYRCSVAVTPKVRGRQVKSFSCGVGGPAELNPSACACA